MKNIIKIESVIDLLKEIKERCLIDFFYIEIMAICGKKSPTTAQKIGTRVIHSL